MKKPVCVLLCYWYHDVHCMVLLAGIHARPFICITASLCTHVHFTPLLSIPIVFQIDWQDWQLCLRFKKTEKKWWGLFLDTKDLNYPLSRAFESSSFRFSPVVCHCRNRLANGVGLFFPSFFFFSSISKNRCGLSPGEVIIRRDGRSGEVHDKHWGYFLKNNNWFEIDPLLATRKSRSAYCCNGHFACTDPAFIQAVIACSRLFINWRFGGSFFLYETWFTSSLFTFICAHFCVPLSRPHPFINNAENLNVRQWGRLIVSWST